MKNKKTISNKAASVLIAVLAIITVISMIFLIISFSKCEKSSASNEASSENSSEETSGASSEETNNNSPDLQYEPNINPDKNSNNANSEYSKSEISKYLTADELKEAINDPFLKLINIDNLLSSSYTPSTKNTYGIPLDKRITSDFSAMMSAARKAGHTDLVANSGYRSYKKQTELYNRKINLFKNKGYNSDEAEKKAGEIVAKPGSSEHQYGMSADICNRAITSKYGNLNEAFAKTDTYKWLIENSAKYGFVLRYPEDKYNITKIVYEPWHYRYVGKKHAKIMNEKNFCLEEYTAYLQKNYNKYFK